MGSIEDFAEFRDSRLRILPRSGQLCRGAGEYLLDNEDSRSAVN
jgi:hypothetical protein